MTTPFVVTTENGTMFSIKPDGMTEVLRKDQPACKVPTFDLLQAAKIIKAVEFNQEDHVFTLRDARDKLREAMKIRCTCSADFGFQRDGCGCGSKEMRKAAETQMNLALDVL